MADLSDLQSAQTVKIAGANPSTGIEDNYVEVDTNGNLKTLNYTDSATGSSNPPVTSQIGGTDGTNLRTLSTDTSGKLNVLTTNRSTISNLNSSTTLLSGGATFTGSFESILGYSSVCILINSDSLATTSALNVDFSTNGTNTDKTIPIDIQTGGEFVQLPAEGQFVRIRVTAGGSAQTVMRLQTIYSGATLGNKYTPLIDSLSDSSAALVARAVMVGRSTSGSTYVTAKVNPSGTLTVDASGSTVTVQGPSGAAGTPSGGILTVQGVNAGVPFPSSFIDTGNSTSSLLTANSTYTGTWVDVSSYSNLNIIIFTDQVSATDGLKIEYSTDGTNIDDNDLFTVPASNGQQLSFPLPAKYYRIRYTNGTTNQGAFRLQSKLSNSRGKPSSQRIGSSANAEQDAEIVVSVPAKINLVASSPTSATIGVTSGTVIASNSNRRGLVLTNTSTLGILSINAIGGTATNNTGIIIYPRGTWVMDDYTFTTSAITAISTVASTVVSIQEFTY